MIDEEMWEFIRENVPKEYPVYDLEDRTTYLPEGIPCVTVFGESIGFRNAKGTLHRDLGPAIVRKNGGHSYFTYGFSYHENDYWLVMYEKYRDTEHAAFVMSKILGQDGV